MICSHDIRATAWFKNRQRERSSCRLCDLSDADAAFTYEIIRLESVPVHYLLAETQIQHENSSLTLIRASTIFPFPSLPYTDAAHAA
jgi:hypothetical protein